MMVGFQNTKVKGYSICSAAVYDYEYRCNKAPNCKLIYILRELHVHSPKLYMNLTLTWGSCS